MTDKEIIVKIYVQPNAKQLSVCGLHDGFIKIKIPVPALENKANEYLCRLLSKEFDVPLSFVELIKGHKSRYKTLKIKKPNKTPDWY